MRTSVPGARRLRFGLVFWLTVLLLSAARVPSLNVPERRGEAVSRVATTP